MKDLRCRFKRDHHFRSIRITMTIVGNHFISNRRSFEGHALTFTFSSSPIGRLL